MSWDSNKRKLLIGTGVAGLFILGIWWLSTAVGADFRTTLDALWHSIPVIVIVSGLTWYFKPNIFAGFAVMAAALWPVWWRVLDSIAANPQSADPALMVSSPWWASAGFKWAVELVLIALAGWLFFRGKNRR